MCRFAARPVLSREKFPFLGDEAAKSTVKICPEMRAFVPAHAKV